MQTPLSTAPRRRRPGRRWIAVAGAVLIVTVALASVFATRTDEETQTLPPAAGFKLSYPSTWEPLGKEELAALPKPPLALLRRENGKAVMVIRRDKPALPNADKFAEDLDREFKRRLRDYRRVAARTVKLPAGRSFFFSYVRGKKGTLHTLVIVPTRSGSYVFNAVSVPGDEEVAGEIGAMLNSFRP